MDNLDFNYFCQSCDKSMAYRQANCFTNYRVRQYKKGDYLFYRGDLAKELSILVRGSVNTELVLDSGIVYTTVLHHAPYAFGALAIFAKENYYRADFVALEDCDLISVSRSDIEQQMVSCRTFLRNFIAYNTSKVDMFTRHLAMLSHKNIKAKLAFYILSLSQGGRYRFDKRLEPLATYMCVERPSLSRAISQLVESDIISYSRGEGEIFDAVALKNLMD